jgi:hypothetical protein
MKRVMKRVEALARGRRLEAPVGADDPLGWNPLPARALVVAAQCRRQLGYEVVADDEKARRARLGDVDRALGHPHVSIEKPQHRLHALESAAATLIA